jgi:hypothetical protein
MKKVILKTANRSSSVERAAVRKAVSDAFASYSSPRHAKKAAAKKPQQLIADN